MPDIKCCRECGRWLPMKGLTCAKCGARQGQGGIGDNIRRDLPNSIIICFRNYMSFQGRAPRAEFWWFALFQAVAQWSLPLAILMIKPDVGDTPGAILSLGLLVPSISVAVRRLHDVDRSGWWIWIALVPVVGLCILLVWDCMPGTRGANRFGPPNGVA